MERIICLVIGYVCGLFQTGYIIGKVHKTDIREHGSGNAGTTNAFRTFGKKAGVLTLLGDCLKCVLAIVIVRMVYGNSMNTILPLLTLYAALGCILVFFALFFTTHYVSLCSLSAYAVAFILVLVFGHMGKYGMDQPHTMELYIVMAVLTAMAFYRHRANIVRLLHGTENKVFLSSKNKK